MLDLFLLMKSQLKGAMRPAGRTAALSHEAARLCACPTNALRCQPSCWWVQSLARAWAQAPHGQAEPLRQTCPGSAAEAVPRGCAGHGELSALGWDPPVTQRDVCGWRLHRCAVRLCARAAQRWGKPEHKECQVRCVCL